MSTVYNQQLTYVHPTFNQGYNAFPPNWGGQGHCVSQPPRHLVSRPPSVMPDVVTANSVPEPRPFLRQRTASAESGSSFARSEAKTETSLVEPEAKTEPEWNTVTQRRKKKKKRTIHERFPVGTTHTVKRPVKVLFDPHPERSAGLSQIKRGQRNANEVWTLRKGDTVRIVFLKHHDVAHIEAHVLYTTKNRNYKLDNKAQKKKKQQKKRVIPLNSNRNQTVKRQQKDEVTAPLPWVVREKCVNGYIKLKDGAKAGSFRFQ